MSFNNPPPQSWNTTYQRLRAWQNETPHSVWNLRQILSQSQFFEVIASGAANQDSQKPNGMSWMDWWYFFSPEMDERRVLRFLLHAWNVDVKRFIEQQSQIQTHQFLKQHFPNIDLNDLPPA